METPKSYLFITVDGGGNIPPVLGLARRLKERGHRVRVLTEPCLETVVMGYGLEYLPFTEYFTRTSRKEDIIGDWDASPLSNPVFDNIVIGPADIVVRETHEALKAEPTDVLVADCLLFPAMIAAESLNIPTAILFHMPEYLPGPNRPPGVMGLLPGRGLFGRWRDRLLGSVFNLAVSKYLPPLNELRAQYGLSPVKQLFDMFHQAERRLIQTSRAFDFPIEPAPENVRYTGPVLDDPDWVEPWVSPWGEDDERPLVVVSFSSTFQNQRGAIENCIAALGELPVRGLATLGPALSSERLQLPDNVVAVSSAPHGRVFPQADLVITHAGHGTLMRALANGLPLVCLPMGRDQNDNAAKVAHHGVGLRLSAKAKPGKIGQAVVRILADQNFRENARRLGSRIVADAQKNMAVRELEKLAAERKEVTKIIE